MNQLSDQNDSPCSLSSDSLMLPYGNIAKLHDKTITNTILKFKTATFKFLSLSLHMDILIAQVKFSFAGMHSIDIVYG